MYFTDYYIPLVNVAVDTARLKKEIDSFVRVDYNAPIKARDFGITTTKQFVDDPFFNFRQYQRKSNPDQYGVRRLPDGSLDTDVVYWPTKMNNTYIKELMHVFNRILGIEAPRVRLSVLNGPHSLPAHYDEHTPWRVHIALQTSPDTNWIFENETGLRDVVHQPVTPVPVLINTGDVKHGLFVPPGVQRIHIWYQYHKYVDQSIIKKLQNDILIKEKNNASTTT